MNVYEIIAFMLYLVAMLAIGISFFIKDKANSEKDYFLGGRNMSGCVAGIIAGAVVSIIWLYVPFNAALETLSTLTNLYAIIPGFIASLVASIIVTLKTEEPSSEVIALFEEVVNSDELKYDAKVVKADKVEIAE